MSKREQAKALLNGYFGAAGKGPADATVRIREKETGFSCRSVQFVFSALSDRKMVGAVST